MEQEQQDRISKIYEGSTIFITGASGFLGKVLLEKLLRTCNVKKIYILLRVKKGKEPQDRLQDIFGNVLFSGLKSTNPSVFNRCVVLPGDATQAQLGLSAEHRLLLQNEAEFIFHSAASTRFDDSVRTALKANTIPTREALKIAEDCMKLRCFVHVSTAYAFPDVDVLEEKAYPPPQNVNKVLEVLESGNEEALESLAETSPNTYTFSKALAEALVVEKMKKVPAIIARPSVVCPIMFEPLPGWCNNLQGPTGLFVGAGKGIIRSMYMQESYAADFIPADVAIHNIMTNVWNFLQHPDTRFYNVVASKEFSYSWQDVIRIGKEVIYNDVPFNGVVWYPRGSIKNKRWVHNICFYLFQIVPAFLIDLLLMILGYKPILFQIQRRIQKGGEVFQYYTNKNWIFKNTNIRKVDLDLNDTERKFYLLSGTSLNINIYEYFKNCILGARRYNLKETDDTIPRAKFIMKIMWILDIVFKGLFLCWLTYNTFKLAKPFLKF